MASLTPIESNALPFKLKSVISIEIIFRFKGIREETGFHISRIPYNTINCTECEEIVKMKNLGFVQYFDFKTIKHYFYFFQFNLMDRIKSNLINCSEMP